MKKMFVLLIVMGIFAVACDKTSDNACNSEVEYLKTIKDDQINKMSRLIRNLIKNYNITLPECMFTRERNNESNYCLDDDSILFHCEPEFLSEDNPKLQTGYSCEAILAVE